jgi:hypothetical protein
VYSLLKFIRMIIQNVLDTLCAGSSAVLLDYYLVIGGVKLIL